MNLRTRELLATERLKNMEPDELKEREILSEKYRRTRRTLVVVYGLLAGVSLSLALNESWHGTSGSSRFYGGLFLTAVSILNMLYFLCWFYAPWRDPLQIRSAELKIELRQKGNEKRLMRIYGLGIILFPIVIAIVLLLDWVFQS